MQTQQIVARDIWTFGPPCKIQNPNDNWSFDCKYMNPTPAEEKKALDKGSKLAMIPIFNIVIVVNRIQAIVTLISHSSSAYSKGAIASMIVRAILDFMYPVPLILCAVGAIFKTPKPGTSMNNYQSY